MDHHSIPNLLSIFLLASASEGSNIERIYIIVVDTLVWPTRSWLNDLQVKVSYGSTGNSGISAYKALGLVGSGPLYNGVSCTAVANTLYRKATTTSLCLLA